MKKGIRGTTLVGILLFGLTLPAVASAGFFNWGCRYQGTWLGIQAPDNQELAGWLATVEGKSYFYGTNNLEFTTDVFDITLDGQLPHVVDVTTSRGNWMRTGYNTFAYTTTGFGLDANRKIVYTTTLSGRITLSEDCNSDVITGMVSIFFPGTGKNPLIHEPDIGPFPIDDVYGFRAFVDLR